MGDVVSLKRARKAKARTDHEAQAAANRVAFGRTKAEKAADAREQTRREATLDGAKLTDS
ncbi:DUF4169 family protein [Sphingomonas endophytica]|uniref:Uncharacterized protein n=1 Tax=Sphingomonas endophytica TaxID=869719 RepID=A0A147HYN8_9SPHN|nr:DUF4169 family protein [Sphingomonas endophytica]KTT70117.1 hypothetical protein NS334_13165 [Sphingomonas endophytica]